MTEISTAPSAPSVLQRSLRLPQHNPRTFLLLAALAWWLLYQSLLPASEVLVAWLPIDRATHLGGALQFFLYDTPKVLLLLTGVVFVMGMINSYFTPERTRAMLAGRSEGAANVMAAGLGIVTPFCSCSAVPLFIGFVQAGVPLGVTFSFLISAPMVNEVALALLFGLFGWKIAMLYMGLGLSIAVVAGWVIGRLKMERYLEDWVRDMPRVQATADGDGLTLAARIEGGFASVREIVGKVWPYILVGIAIGAGIHGWVPQDFMASFMGKEAWWSVPLAVLIGVPMYTNAAGVIPIVQALLAKGAALGTVLAFMMSVIALSLPEMIILRKVLKVRLIATFMGVVATGILIVGYVFNAIL
ncbi:MAG: permease [Burkholderiaceae bacterium]|nr:permease [Burkholderiaceae bacterium]